MPGGPESSQTMTAKGMDSRRQEQGLPVPGWAEGPFWAVLNTFQFLFLATWSAFWITSALVVLCLTFDRERAISFAHKYWAPGIMWAAGATMDVDGFEKLDPDQPYVFVFNHESLVDTAVVFYSVPLNVRFVAKKEVSYIPFIGWYVWAMGFVFVDRKNHERAMASMAAMAKTVREGANVIFFAEGTRSRDGKIQEFKKGAFNLAIEAGAPIVPCTIYGSRNSLACDGFKVRPATIRVRAGQPIETTGMTRDDRDVLRDQARQCIVDMHQSLGN